MALWWPWVLLWGGLCLERLGFCLMPSVSKVSSTKRCLARHLWRHLKLGVGCQLAYERSALSLAFPGCYWREPKP